MFFSWRQGVLAGLLFGAGFAHAGSAAVAVIYGEESTPAGGRTFAQSLARHAVRWYRDAGLTVSTGSDTNLEGLLSGSRVALLIQLSTPSPLQMTFLRNYAQSGGHLIVCYSSSAPLADLMGVEVGGYLKGDTGGRWSCMHFEGSRPQGVPESILQTSPNLFLVKPLAGQSQVIAWWEDRMGRQMPEPAWLMSKHGYWMTHVLLGDGDVQAKAQLLLALAASCDPSLWNAAAQQKLLVARKTGPFDGSASLVRAAKSIDDPARRSVVQSFVRTATNAEQLAVEALRDGRGWTAWQQAERLRHTLELAYGWMQSSVGGEMTRGVWDRSGMGLYPGDWARTCQLLKECGISDLYVCAGGPGFSHYHSAILPPSRIYLEQGDQLAACLAAAKPCGLRVHAWLYCFSADQATDDRMAVFRSKGWLISGEDGRERRWLDPAASEVREQLIQAARELATHYAIDGVHIDFVRYPDYAGCLGPSVQKRFESFIGKRVANWPDEVKLGQWHAEFMRWRCDQVTELVSGMRNMLRLEAPGKLLTAAVYGKYPSCMDAVGQDWESWLRQGYVDYLLPMDYTENMDLFNELVKDQARARWLRKHMIPGIGVTAAESRLDAAQTIDQLRVVREEGCAGFALFDLNTYLEREILPVLKVGMTGP